MIWAQTAATVGEARVWGASQIIALVAATGTILAVLVTGVSIYFNYLESNRRLAGENLRHTEQLAHERRLVHEANAAKAYRVAKEVQNRIQWSDVQRVAVQGENQLPPEDKFAITTATNAIMEAKAYAWREEIATAAEMVIVALVDLKKQANATIRELTRKPGDGDPESPKRAIEQFQLRWKAYGSAIEDFRMEITK